MECVTCGGADFYKESGYFYCNECQTQSQEVREHVFQEENANVNVKSTKRIRSPKVDKKSERKVTSWECYNIVLSSLANQLINLGAEASLKRIVKCLWLRLLEKLEVVSMEKDIKPKLQLVNVKKDIGILYGTTRRRKRRRQSSSDESNTASKDSASLKRERTKKKRALAVAEYEDSSHKSTHGSPSLQNETLSSLKGNLAKPSDNKIEFNYYSIRELKKKMYRKHCQEHKSDKEQQLTCHKLTYGNTSEKYWTSAHVLTPQKLYCILYLGLLITKDKMQLGDLFRFIKEGHLSFNSYSHLFPESYSDKFLNIRNNNKNQLFSSKEFRVTTAKMAKFLKVVTFIQVPDLVRLCSLYCSEMNLPEAMTESVLNILSKTKPRLKMTLNGAIIPNYEGRVMSFILFTLKVLYGLDGVTEFRLSEFAKCLNAERNVNMFDIGDWMMHLGTRSLLMAKYHFPTSYWKNYTVNSDLFLQYIKSSNTTFEESKTLGKEMSNYKEVLTRIKDLQHYDTAHVEFPPSLTPLLSYSEVLLRMPNDKSTGILQKSFKCASLDYLLRPNKYLEVLKKNIEIKNGGANDNWVVEDLYTYRNVKGASRTNYNLIPVNLVTDSEDEVAEPSRVVQNTDSQSVQQIYNDNHKHVFFTNNLTIKKYCEEHVLQGSERVVSCKKTKFKYTKHFNPFERHWLNVYMNITMLRNPEFKKFFANYPHTFRLIFTECSQIIGQSQAELYEEFQFAELFLVFVAGYGEVRRKNRPRRKMDEKLRYYVNRADANW